MTIDKALTQIIAGNDLSQEETRKVFDEIMSGDATAAQIAGILIGLRVKGEAVSEITGATIAMRKVSTKVNIEVDYLVDTCGTGGSGSNKLFNISTAAAFVTAAAGAHVAKHGNRGMSSSSGSADVLDAAGVNIQMPPDVTARAIAEIGVGFMFAQTHHPAMKFAGPVRRELGVRTLFNLIGPLTNPAGAKRQIIGVFAPEWQKPIAEVCQLLGSEHVLVVHANGLDELTITGESRVVELKNNKISQFNITPDDFGIPDQSVEGLRVNSPKESLALIKSSLKKGNHSAASDIVALNAGAAIYVSGITRSLSDGVAMAEDLISTGQAGEKLSELVRFSEITTDSKD